MGLKFGSSRGGLWREQVTLSIMSWRNAEITEESTAVVDGQIFFFKVAFYLFFIALDFCCFVQIFSGWGVQVSHSVVSDSLWPHGLPHARPPCPSPTPGACSNSCPPSRWCHPTISSSVVPFSSCLQSFPGSGSFQMSQFFTSGGQSIGVSASASVLPMNIQDWFRLGWTGWISLQSKGLSRVFSNTTFQRHQFLRAQLVAVSGGRSSLWFAVFSLPWLLLLWSMGSRCGGFSSCGVRAPQLWLAGPRAQAQWVWHTGLGSPWHVESSQTSDGTRVCCLGQWTLIHRTTREVWQSDSRHFYLLIIVFPWDMSIIYQLRVRMDR